MGTAYGNTFLQVDCRSPNGEYIAASQRCSGERCIRVNSSPLVVSKSMSATEPILIATRGSALALAQANRVLELCRRAFPKLAFELKIVKTTGDKLQTTSLAQQGGKLPKGLFA